MNEESLPLQFPLFIKPLDSGGGIGIDNQSVVHTFVQYTQKVQAVYDKLLEVVRL